MPEALESAALERLRRLDAKIQQIDDALAEQRLAADEIEAQLADLQREQKAHAEAVALLDLRAGQLFECLERIEWRLDRPDSH